MENFKTIGQLKRLLWTRFHEIWDKYPALHCTAGSPEIRRIHKCTITETSSALLLTLCVGNSPVCIGFPSLIASNTELWCFVCCYHSEMSKNITIPVISKQTPCDWRIGVYFIYVPLPYLHGCHDKAIDGAIRRSGVTFTTWFKFNPTKDK